MFVWVCLLGVYSFMCMYPASVCRNCVCVCVCVCVCAFVWRGMGPCVCISLFIARETCALTVWHPFIEFIPCLLSLLLAAVCNPPCQNSMPCMKPNVCSCEGRFSGARCEIDVDECAKNNSCSPYTTVCVNTVGSYFCQCRQGFVPKDTYECKGTDNTHCMP